MHSLASLKFDYLLSRLSSMPPLDSSLVFPVSLISPLLWHNNLIGFPSSPSLNSKFFSSFLILNSVLLLNTFAITSDPLSLLPLSTVSAIPNIVIFSCLVLGQPWPILGPLLLLVRHSGITSLLIFARLFSLLPVPHLYLALSLAFFLELKALLFGLHREKCYINIYIQDNTIFVFAITESPLLHCTILFSTLPSFTECLSSVFSHLNSCLFY